MSISSEIPFEALISFHKQEGQEAMAYLTILFTIILGIIGYLGSAQKIERSARILILIFYSLLHITLVTSFLGSIRMHSAIHTEISNYAKKNPKLFIGGEESTLYNKLIALDQHPIELMTFGGYLILAFVIICILGIGENSILRGRLTKG